MTKKLLLVLLFFIFCENCKAQLELHIQELNSNKNAIHLEIEVKNTSQKDSVLFYFPRDESVFMSLIKLVFKSKETGKVHEYWPSDEILDIDSLFVTKNNSVLILPGCTGKFQQEVKLKRIFPHLADSKYSLSMQLSYEDENLESDVGYELFKGAMKSNSIEINR
ncbi:hypothetical protein [Marinifilum sp. D737]|uniref:hypothetical protein n=1 Tax=Marinifilum sp. D737 TaxID=2969628 RepID=UPI00227295E6|nr:hypothetical protein [Marinifilum sp. D737]MCY1635486.1 hypothetical protein [Marinifilum sp. D737]